MRLKWDKKYNTILGLYINSFAFGQDGARGQEDWRQDGEVVVCAVPDLCRAATKDPMSTYSAAEVFSLGLDNPGNCIRDQFGI